MDIGLEIEQGTGYEVASAVKTPDGSFVRQSGTSAATANELRSRLEEAKTELSDAIDSADLERMTALRAEIKALPEQITLAEVRELKERLFQIEIDLENNDSVKKLLRQITAHRKAELQEKLDELRPYYERLNKCGLEMSFADNTYQMLLVERREKKALLFSLTDDLKNENI